MHVLRPALTDEAGRCYGIIEEAKAFQREQGFIQWTEDYPNRNTVLEDLQAGKGYALLVDGRIAGYMCVDFDGEPAYTEIDGAWGTEEPYAVVHRMAFGTDFQGKGLADTAFRQIEALCLSRGVQSIRMDTDFPNLRMQHILEKNGFLKRGVIVFQGGGKLAYDKADYQGSEKSHRHGLPVRQQGTSSGTGEIHGIG